MKMVWHGSISFGLVNIPIALYPAVKQQTFGFHMLCGICHTQITYHYWCPHCKKERSWDSLVKGFKDTSDRVTILTKEHIKVLKPEVTKQISIKEFVPTSEVKLLYIDSHYYLAPTAEGKNDAFFLFIAALKKSDTVAIGQFVMHDKEHIAAITVHEHMILLSTLHYEYEIRTPDFKTSESKEHAVDKKELILALQLIDKLTHTKFDLKKYKDTFVLQLKEAIAAAHKKGKKKAVPTKRSPKKRSLTTSLEESFRVKKFKK